MTNREKLVTFIKKNGLKFTGVGSELNSECTILSGYADYCGVMDTEEVVQSVRTALPKSRGFETELSKVFDYAFRANYGNFWKTPAAKKQYIF